MADYEFKQHLQYDGSVREEIHVQWLRTPDRPGATVPADAPRWRAGRQGVTGERAIL
jgi:hypothetical protein